MNTRSYPEITLNELPRYSDWPSRLLAMDPEPVRHKTREEVLREFNRDKWGSLLQQATQEPNFDLCAAERLEIDPETIIPFYESARLWLVPFRHALQQHVELYADVLAPFASTATALVELGAGFGSKILRLGAHPSFAHLPLHAAELTSNGQALIELLAARAGRHISVGTCDFREGTLSHHAIPADAVVFTSFAVHYVPELSAKFIQLISGLKPRVVVHFEPCLEHMETDSLHGLMCRSYVVRNDYNRNLVSLLESEARVGHIRILSVRRSVMGGNPLLPLSVIAWQP